MLDQHLGSAISTSGQPFPLVLAAPIVIDGKEVVPAGTRGVGEVVHAKKSGGSGTPGELVLAARYLEIGGQHMRLRSLNLAVAGQDAYNQVNRLVIATAATVPAVALVGFFMKGKDIDIPGGQEANAKTAEPFIIESVPPAGAPAGQQGPLPPSQ